MRIRYNSLGFTLLEIMIVIAIIASLATLIPNLGQRKPRYEREQFIARLNALCQYAWQQSFITRELHAVRFDLNKHTVIAQKNTGRRDQEGNQIMEALKGVHAQLTYPAHLEIKHFFIEQFDELKRTGIERKVSQIFFYIVPEGLAQEVTINFIDKKDTFDRKARSVELVLNPFTAQFKVYDTVK